MRRMILLFSMFALLLCGCGAEEVPESTGSTAMTIGIVMNTQPVETEPAPAPVPQTLGVSAVEMQAQTWSSPNGATIHIKALPTAWFDGLNADFLVRLEGDEVVRSACDFEDGWFTASAEVTAENGLCYSLVFWTEGSTEATEVAVNTPADPVSAELIDLADSLRSYASLIVTDSQATSDGLTLSAEAQVQAPKIHNLGQDIVCKQASLVLSCNGETLDEAAIPMAEGDDPGAFVGKITDQTFDLPALAEDQQLLVTLVAELSNGQKFTAQGGAIAMDGEMLVGSFG